MKLPAVFYFVQLLIVHFAFVIGQADIECTPDPCETRCSRYLNARCINNTEDCSARYMWKGSDVTRRCNVRTCATRNCAGRNRDCMENVFPPNCASGDSTCRQYIRSRCILIPPPRPLSCDDIECDDGFMCRFRERVEGFFPVVRCVPRIERPRDCSELTCDEGFECILRDRRPSCVPIITTPDSCSEVICNNNEICVEVSNTPICIPLTTSVTPFPSGVTPTSTTPNIMVTAESCDQLDCASLFLMCNQLTETLAVCEPVRECTAEFNATCSMISLVCDISPNNLATCVLPSSCSQLTCNAGQNCFEFNSGDQTAATCVDSEVPMIGLKCENLTCPTGQGCVLSAYPSLNLSVASCVDNIVFNSIVASTQFLNLPTCSDMECISGTVCVDIRMDENSIAGSCIPQMCSSDSDCGNFSQCLLLTPLNLTGLPDSICTPRALESMISNNTCEENERICPEGTVCQNAYINETLIGTACNMPANIGEACDEIDCVEENTGCIENSIPSMPELPHLASCLINFNQTTMATIQGLRALGLIE